MSKGPNKDDKGKKKKPKKAYVAPIIAVLGTLTAMPVYANQSNT